MKMPVADIKQALITMDDSKLAPEMLKQILSYVPDTNEVHAPLMSMIACVYSVMLCNSESKLSLWFRLHHLVFPILRWRNMTHTAANLRTWTNQTNLCMRWAPHAFNQCQIQTNWPSSSMIIESFQMSRIPGFDQRLKALLFKSNFAEKVEEVKDVSVKLQPAQWAS